MGNISTFNLSSGAVVLSDITDTIKAWDYEPVSGIGFYRKHDRYGHIEIIITTHNDYYDSIAWQIDEHHIPLQHREQIESRFIFFINYLRAIKGTISPCITISIINGSYHPINSDIRAYDMAIFYAIRNCFDKEFGKLIPAHEIFLKSMQQDRLQLCKYNATKFSEKQILESLKDLGLNNILKAILNNHNRMIIENHAERFSTGLAAIITDNASEEVLENLRLGHIISKYNDITYIGWAHIGVIVKKREMLNKLGIRNLSSVKGYYDISFM